MTGVLIRREDWGCRNTERRAHVRAHGEDSHLQAKERSPQRKPALRYLDFGLLVSRIVRNKFLLFKPSSLWYFVMATLAN